MNARTLLMLALAGFALSAFASDPAEVLPPSPKVGDRWVYVFPTADGKTGKVNAEVTRVDRDGIVIRRGTNDVLYSTPWVMVSVNSPKNSMVFKPGLDTIPFPLKVGSSHSQTTVVADSASSSSRTDESVTRVVGWEDVSVPAGKFRVIRVYRKEVNGVGTPARQEREGTYWYSPELRNHVQVENVAPNGRRVLLQLESFRIVP